MNISERQRYHQKLKCEVWAERRIDGGVEVKKLDGLRQYALDKLAPNLAKELNIDLEIIKKSLNEHMPDFVFESKYSDLEINVASVLLSYLRGKDPFKKKPGRRIVNKERYYAALYAWLITNNIAATAKLFGKDISSFKRDMGNFAKSIDVHPSNNSDSNNYGAYFDALRCVINNRGIMEMSKYCFIDYMAQNHLDKWEDWISSKTK
ncbi:hypothetical protein ACP5PY_12650 [Photobacterium leiognathi subsp. mandapamensis]